MDKGYLIDQERRLNRQIRSERSPRARKYLAKKLRKLRNSKPKTDR